jgi:hypothetical protein
VVIVNDFEKRKKDVELWGREVHVYGVMMMVRLLMMMMLELWRSCGTANNSTPLVHDINTCTPPGLIFRLLLPSFGASRTRGDENAKHV